MKKLLKIIPLIILLFSPIACRQQGEGITEDSALNITGNEAQPGIIVDSATSADGVSINYEMRGQGETAIVFVHGWCCDLGYWNEQLPQFARNYKVVAIDLAGHGESGLDREKWSMGAFGEDVAAVVNKLDLERVVLVGHSMGGPVILEAARLMPARVIGLVGVDTLRDFEEKITQEQLDGLLTPLRADFPEGSKDFVRTMFAANSDPVLIEKIVADMSSAPRDVGLNALEGLVDFQNNELTRVLQEVRAPITCISSDKWPTRAETNQRYAPSFKVKIMPGVGHFNMMEDPETFNRMLEETVQEFIGAAI